MKMVYTNEVPFIVNNVKNLLEAQGIATFVKNEFAQGAVGEISVFDAWPELWIKDDSDYECALEVVESSQGSIDSKTWVCSQCAETNEGSFEVCWNCQQGRE